VLDLGAEEIHVWLVGAEAAASVAHVIDDEERARAERFVFRDTAELFVAAHGAARVILGHHLEVDPATLAFGTEADGKPFLAGDRDAGSDLSFNIAHSGHHALVGIARQRPVGVDLEARRVMARRDALARRIMTPQELARHETIDEEDRTRHLLDVWTRKEALLKARGTGLRVDLRSFSCDPSEHDDWHVVELDVPDYSAAVASTGRRWRPVLHTFAPTG
jgi:4'-phosphopantetheinyl transferase